jgi:hypothetical protein
LKAAKIEFGGGVIDCSIRNISDIVASLEVGAPVGIPERFTLIVTADKQRFACRVVHLKEKRLGRCLRIGAGSRIEGWVREKRRNGPRLLPTLNVGRTQPWCA